MNKTNKYGSFWLKSFYLFVPFIILVLIYVSADPFKVIRKYRDYDSSFVFQNEGAIGWYKYKLYRKRQHYDSFIMGNSCSMAYRGCEWNKYIHGSPFRLFGNSEDIADLYTKLSALDNQRNQPIKNLLIVFDAGTLSDASMQRDAMHIMPPEVSHIDNLIYQLAFFQGFISPEFFIPYAQYNITHVYRSDMHGIIDPIGRAHTTFTNDAINPNERRIQCEGTAYWENKRWAYPRKDHKVMFFARCIFNTQKLYLEKIKSICDKHQTNLKIIINPNINSLRFNTKDLYILQKIFGEKNVFDFTRAGDFYSNAHNYYDRAHYRVFLANKILKVVYARSDTDELTYRNAKNKICHR